MVAVAWLEKNAVSCHTKGKRKTSLSEDQQTCVAIGKGSCAALPDLKVCVDSSLLASEQTWFGWCQGHHREHMLCAFQVLS